MLFSICHFILLILEPREYVYIKKVIISDELWVYGCDLETLAQSSQWKSSGSPHLKKVGQI